MNESLNEVQLPKELQRGTMWSASGLLGSLNEVQLPKELQPLDVMTDTAVFWPQ